MEVSSRKKEISSIFIAISKIEKIEEQELIASYSFPRLYGHYEKFIEQEFGKLVNKILQNDQLKLNELKKKLMYYLLFINFKDMGEEKFFNQYMNLNEDLSIKELKKQKIESHIKNTNVGKNFNYLSSIFEADDEEFKNKLIALKLKISLLSKKYAARNHIAHGHLDYTPLNLEEFEAIKKMIEEMLDLINSIFTYFLSNDLYLNNR